MPMDDLKRLRPVLPVEGSTQHRVTFHHTLPGLLQGLDLEMAMEETLHCSQYTPDAGAYNV